MIEPKRILESFTNEFEAAGKSFLDLAAEDQDLLKQAVVAKWDLVKRNAEGEDVSAQMQMNKAIFATLMSIEANLAERAFNDAWKSALGNVLGAFVAII